MKNGYEQNYELLVQRLTDCDLREAAQRLGLKSPVRNELTVHYMNRAYHINKNGVFPLDGLYSSPNDRSILIHYITSGGSGNPEYKYYLPHHFAQSVLSGGGNFLFSKSFQKEARDFNSIKKAMDILGADYKGEVHTGEHCWHYYIFPKMPIEVIYYEADEEFPCDIKIKFDGSAGKFMGFETLMFMCGSFIQGLLEISRRI